MIKIRSVRKTKKRSKNVIKNKTYRNKWCGVGGLISLGVTQTQQTRQMQQTQQTQKMQQEELQQIETLTRHHDRTTKEPQQRIINHIIEEIKKLNSVLEPLQLKIDDIDRIKMLHENINAKLEEENNELSLMIHEKYARIAELQQSNAAASNAAADISSNSSNKVIGFFSSIASGKPTETEIAGKEREINHRKNTITIHELENEIGGLEAKIKNNDKQKIDITQSSEEIRKKNDLDAKLSILRAEVNNKKAELKQAKDRFEEIQREFNRWLVIWLANFKRQYREAATLHKLIGGRRTILRRRSNKLRKIRRTRRKLL